MPLQGQPVHIGTTGLDARVGFSLWMIIPTQVGVSRQYYPFFLLGYNPLAMDEAELITAAQNEDLDAFNRLVLVYQERAYNVAVRLLNDTQLAEDATQDSFIAAYQHINSFRGGSFCAWILRIVTNNCYDELRRQKRKPEQALEHSQMTDGEEFDASDWLEDDSLSPEQVIEKRELEQAIQHCIDELPVDFRAVVILVDVQGMDYQAVSEVVKKPLGTIKSRLARARKRLQDCLHGFWELLPAKFRLENEGSQ